MGDPYNDLVGDDMRTEFVTPTAGLLIMLAGVLVVLLALEHYRGK